MGVFASNSRALAGKPNTPDHLIIDSIHLKAHGTAATPLNNGAAPRRIGHTRGGLDFNLYAVCDG